ncbi:hypothetical protein JTB14_020796 [Gonioctena quinquepunctata]|nr:hypothetical protein JTB14_020796 [Gonioctena quinquepunctata]
MVGNVGRLWKNGYGRKSNLEFLEKMASNVPDFSYCCEICGLEGLPDEEFRVHTHTAHVDGNAVCPFCELSAVSPAELILHVNQAHLDFLTPESDQNISFIDDPSPNDFHGTNGENNHWNVPSYSSNNKSISRKVKSNININLNPKVNGGGELSPSNSSHGQGSPLRSNLDLKLKSLVTRLQCPMCNYTSLSPNELEEHVNRSHFDLTSPSIGNVTHDVYVCPLCARSFKSAPDLELHVNIEHRDILSPASPVTHSCPVCGINLGSDINTEDVFSIPKQDEDGNPTPDTFIDEELGKSISFELLDRKVMEKDSEGDPEIVWLDDSKENPKKRRRVVTPKQGIELPPQEVDKRVETLQQTLENLVKKTTKLLNLTRSNVNTKIEIKVISRELDQVV